MKTSATTIERFRIMKEPFGTLGFIPFDILRPHEEYAKRQHGGQSLARLSERGGLSAQEAMCIIRRERWHDRTYRAEPAAWVALKNEVVLQFPEFEI